MRLRSRSKTEQWTLWMCAVLAALVLYVLLSDFMYDSVSWNLLNPERYRLAFPLVALVVVFAWETRWDRIVREKKPAQPEAPVPATEAATAGVQSPQPQQACVSETASSKVESPGDELAKPAVPKQVAEASASPEANESRLEPIVELEASDDSATGEELYAKARTLPHRRIPDFGTDAYYMELLGKAVAKGYPPAMSKLGEYAIRRGVWVEAYYWMTQARRHGMHNLKPVLRDIRKGWALDGCSDELGNVSRLFSAEAGSLGRALLHLDSGKTVAAAKEFLLKNYPEYL